MKTYLLLVISISLMGIFYAITEIKLNVTVDNSYFTNKIDYLEKENATLRGENLQNQQFLDERCVCKPYHAGYESPLNKQQICSTPDNQLYFYEQQ